MQLKSKKNFILPVIVLVIVGLVIAAFTALPSYANDPTGSTIYNSIPAPFPGNFPSIGFQARSTDEFGDHIAFADTERGLGTVIIGMSNWACENDFTWNGTSWVQKVGSDPCTTTPGTGYEHPITLNIYEVDNSGTNPQPGALVATKTEEFFMPFRPSADPVNCPTSPTAWYSEDDDACYNGYAFTIEFDFTADNVTVPDEVIYSLAYNTYTHGHNPIGSNGPYSSLNVALNSTGPTIGTDVEFGAFFQDSTWAGAYCTGNQSPLDVFRWDGPCWNYTPVAQFNLVPSTVTLSVSDDLICDAEEAYVDFSDVPDLYGYEFKVEYDAAKVDATGSFLNDWFDTTGQFIVWDADCDAGVCKFSVSKNGTTATPISGDGRVAKIALDPTGGGNFDLKIKDVTLTNIDGFAIPSTLVDDTIEVGACGTAKVSGKVSLQGRVTPMNSGWVTFINTDSSGFADLTVNFDANGNYSAEVPVMPTGSAYKVRAFHYLYLANEKAAQTLTPGQTLNNQNTRLLGGDANNSGVYTPFTPGVEALDIGCIGGDFGGSSDSCGADPNSSTDINNDGHVNIQDLSIAGGNFDKNPFQNW